MILLEMIFKCFPQPVVFPDTEPHHSPEYLEEHILFFCVFLLKLLPGVLRSQSDIQ